MTYNPILNRNYLLELVSYADYPSILRLCSSNRELSQVCKHDQQIRNIINGKRISEKTDRFLQKTENPLNTASKLGDVEIVDELLNRGYDPDFTSILIAIFGAYNSISIHDASSKGHLDVIDRLLQDERVDPSSMNNQTIRNASYYGYLPGVERLLQDVRVDPSDKKNDAIKLASLAGHLPIVERLLKDYRVWNSLPTPEKDKYFKQIGKRIYSPLPPNTIPFPPSIDPNFYPLPPAPPTGPPFTTQFPTEIPTRH